MQTGSKWFSNQPSRLHQPVITPQIKKETFNLDGIVIPNYSHTSELPKGIRSISSQKSLFPQLKVPSTNLAGETGNIEHMKLSLLFSDSKKTSQSVMNTERTKHSTLSCDFKALHDHDSLNDPNRRHEREEVQAIFDELEKNIQQLGADPDYSDPNIRNKANQFYNYALNCIILFERFNNSKVSILIRTIQKYFNDAIESFPEILEKMKDQITNLNVQLLEKEQINDNLKEDIRRNKLQIDKLEKEVIEKTNLLQQIAKESNNKDVLINSNTFDLDYYQSQITNLTYQLNNKVAECNRAINAIKLRDEENSKLLQQLEVVEKEVHQYQSDQYGYITKSQKVYQENENYKKQIESLTKKIDEFTNVSHESIATNTDPISKHSRKHSTNDNIKLLPSKSESSKIGRSTIKSIQNQKRDLFSENSSLDSFDTTFATSLGQYMLSGSAEQFNNTQTESDRQINQSRTSFYQDDNETKPNYVSKEIETEFNMENSQISKVLEISDFSVLPQEKSSENQSVLGSEYINPDGYDQKSIDESIINSVPSLLPIVIPLFAIQYSESFQSDLFIFNVHSRNNAPVITNDKPLEWCLQIIHEFLSDPFIRSYQSLSKVNGEAILSEWLSIKFKLPHIVKQVTADLAFYLDKFSSKPLIFFFNHLINGTYTISQLCFGSVIYSFTTSYTFPSLPAAISKRDKNETYESQHFMIHYLVIHKILSLALSSNLADEFINTRIKIHPPNPMLDYIEFLTEAVNFFGEKHQQIYTQSRNLLLLCNCYDLQYISFDAFHFFNALLGEITNQNDIKKIQSMNQSHAISTITFSNLLTFCAERSTPLFELLKLPPLSKSVARYKELQPHIAEFYSDILIRFVRTVPKIMKKMECFDVDLHTVIQKLRESLLEVNIPSILWRYRVFLIKVESSSLNAKGYIDFNYNESTDAIKEMKKYFNVVESVSFSLL